MKLRNIFSIANYQLKISLRSRWMVGFILIFTILAVTITLFSGVNEIGGFQGFNRMTASLLNLSLFITPLFTLLIGATELAGEKEDGGFSLIMTYELFTIEILLGKFIGMFISLFSMISLGYGIAGVVQSFFAGGLSLQYLILFYCLTLLLVVMFLSIGIFIGVISKNRFQALSSALFVWAIAVLFYEFIIMGISMVAPKQSILSVISVSVFLNPVELIRTWTIIMMKSEAVFGPSLYDFTIWSKGVYGQLVFSFSLVCWVVIPLIVANFFVKRGIGNGA